MFLVEANTEQSNLPHFAYHRCKVKFDDNREAEIVYGELDSNEKRWWLHIYRLLTWDDIEKDLADMEGEPIEQVAIPINFCPYCGQDLSDNLQAKVAKIK